MLAFGRLPPGVGPLSPFHRTNAEAEQAESVRNRDRLEQPLARLIGLTEHAFLSNRQHRDAGTCCQRIDCASQLLRFEHVHAVEDAARSALTVSSHLPRFIDGSLQGAPVATKWLEGFGSPAAGDDDESAGCLRCPDIYSSAPHLRRLDRAVTYCPLSVGASVGSSKPGRTPRGRTRYGSEPAWGIGTFVATAVAAKPSLNGAAARNRGGMAKLPSRSR